MKLSILVCALEKREEFHKTLMPVLGTQKAAFKDEVEILVEIDNGEKSIGTKRNLLLERAKGDYIVFIDDDDMISDTYVSRILECIDKSQPDVIGIHLIMTTDKVTTEKTYHLQKLKPLEWRERKSENMSSLSSCFFLPNRNRNSFCDPKPILFFYVNRKDIGSLLFHPYAFRNPIIVFYSI